MKRLFKFMTYFALSFSAFIANGQIPQTTKESVVIISEDAIASLIKTLKKYKKVEKVSAIEKPAFDKQITESSIEYDFLQQQIEQLELQVANQKPIENKKIEKSISTSENGEITALQLEVAELKGMLQQLLISTNNKTNVVTIPPQKEIIVKQPTLTPPSVVANTNEDLTKRIDSLNTLLKAIENKQPSNYTTNFENLQQRLQELKNELAVKNKEAKTNEELVVKYKDYKKQLFFENNSITVSETQMPLVDELVEIIVANPTVDIYIKGFASNKGKPTYNQNISLQRTEAVKKLLVSKGIHPTRILTQYQGIDYLSTSESLARRVDIELLIRN